MSQIYGALLVVLLAGCDPADSSPPVAPVTAVSATPAQSAEPPPASSELTQQSNLMNIMLRGDGTAEVDGKPIPNDEALFEAANKAVAINPAVQAIVNADGIVPHARVIHVLDMLKKARFVRVSFGSKPAD